MAWLILIVAGLMEIAWALGMKYSEGLTRIWPSVITIIFIVWSLLLLNISMKSLPVGTAYGVWTGIGIVGTATFGIMFFREPAHPLRIACIILILIGIVGLRLVSGDTV
jgi:quaternary ammonium compound-resistance protein SugE